MEARLSKPMDANDAPKIGETSEPIRGGNDHETVGLRFMGLMMCHYTIDAMAHGQYKEITYHDS
jgi:hypothetical protein